MIYFESNNSSITCKLCLAPFFQMVLLQSVRHVLLIAWTQCFLTYFGGRKGGLSYFPTVSQNTAEPHFTTCTKYTKISPYDHLGI